MSMDMIIKPRMSEKAYGLSQLTNTYVFDVPRSANKQTIAAAIEAQFEVSVTGVRVANKKGKAKQTYVKRSRPVQGREAASKRAYVTIKEGEVIPVFAAVEEAEKEQEKKQAALEKATEKAVKKTAKKGDK
jgi:large subunit ribosomal protein L23